MQRYWTISSTSILQDLHFSVLVSVMDEDMPDLGAQDDVNDIVFLLSPTGAPTAVCRAARVRKELHHSTILFDRRVNANAHWQACWEKKHFTSLAGRAIAQVVDDVDAESFLQTVQPKGLTDADPFPGKTEGAIKSHIRDMLVAAFEDDLLGPAFGPHERVEDTAVHDRYLVGRLPPRNTIILPSEADDSESDAQQDGDTSASDGKTALAPGKAMLQPSSIGMTFTVDPEADSVKLAASWGRYFPTDEIVSRSDEDGVSGKEREMKVWRREPKGGFVLLPLQNGKHEFTPDPSDPEITLEAKVRSVSGMKLVSVYLANRAVHNGNRMPKDELWIFQPKIRAISEEGKPIFLRRQAPADAFKTDLEIQKLEMLYRQRSEFAVGHGVSVHWEQSPDDCHRAIYVETRVIPKSEVGATETPGGREEDRPALKELISSGALDMLRLAEQAVPEKKEKLEHTLTLLVDDYEAWIDELETKAKANKELERAAVFAIEECRDTLDRLRRGIHILLSDDLALRAFQFANQAMAEQRIHAMAAESHDLKIIPKLRAEAKTHTWRPFQLAFFLLQIPSLANPADEERTEDFGPADLLWFPTGGGKTEAYLGAAAFAMAARRLQPTYGPNHLDGSRGLVVIIRYTLRLLTLQQFRRASILICAMECIRRKEESIWGTEPFTIGLWAGKRVTPNLIKDAAKEVEDARDPSKKRYRSNDTPFQVTRCPWCGTELSVGRDVRIDEEQLRAHLFCPNRDCDFNELNNPEGLPLKMIDEEIYRRPPTLIVATVDKFAQLPLNGNTRTLFGFAERECPRHGLVLPDCDCGISHTATSSLPAVKVRKITGIRPPDLIIQDEFHLISGPLGTMTGLFETAVDALCSWDIHTQNGTKTVRPRIIASTATIRKAAVQMKSVFCRQVQVFPPGGIDVEDNFFSVQRPIDVKPGRLYIGICSPGSSRPPVLIRMYVTLLTAAQDLYIRFGSMADFLMTVVGYFNSLRELGGMKRLCDDDVQTRTYRVEGTGKTKGLITARPGMKNRSIRTTIELTSRMSNEDIPKMLDAIGTEHGQPDSPDIVLATNMLSVGVDVPRLGLMAVNGQPKNTAEYIQATSRVGRRDPGIVCTTFAWSRPRDLSHYETFEHYHQTFYRHVEAQSVTPASSRALEKGLAAIVVAMERLRDPNLSAETAAQNFDQLLSNKQHTREFIKTRIWQITESNRIAENTAGAVDSILSEWDTAAKSKETDLVYTNPRKVERPNQLLNTSTFDKNKGIFRAPNSMREVEASVALMLDTATLGTKLSFNWDQSNKQRNSERNE